MQSNPSVTIAIPTFNGASGFLRESLTSACAQDYENLEILISDNASTDATSSLVRSWGDSRIRYHLQPENIGAPRNINSCVSMGRGEYLLMLMDDDLIDADFISLCIEGARQDPAAAMIRTGTRVVDFKGNLMYESLNRTQGLSFRDFVIAWTKGLTAPFQCSTLFRTEPLQELGFHSRYGLWSDVVTELQLAARYTRVDIPDVKATFRIHPQQRTATARIENWCEESLELLTLIDRLAPDDSDPLSAHAQQFLAMFNYRLALQTGPWSSRLAACSTVYRMLQKSPDVTQLAREELRRTRIGHMLRQLKQRFLPT
jgi:glycosyltransferase involved in cell wall biosynthesis